MIDSPVRQLEAAATRGNLVGLFGPLTFDGDDVARLEACGEGDDCEVSFVSDGLPLGIMFVELYCSGNPEDEGLTVGLRGWGLNPEIAGV